MKKALVSVVIVTFLSLIYSGTGLAEEPVSFSLGANIGYLSGNTLYHITIPINEVVSGLLVTYGESELEFPLDSAIGGVAASLGKKGIWSLDLSVSKNLTKDTGKTKDSDWLTVVDIRTGETERGLIIYSESDTDMDAFQLDISGKYYFLKRERTSLGIIAGYRYQNFSFDISDLEQIDAWGGYNFVPGKVATYEITYNIPYGGVAFDLRPSNRFSLNFSGAIGWASAEDEDNHILRSKRSTSKSDGPFYLLKAQGNLSLSHRLFLQMALEYLRIDTDGTQDQIRYANTSEGPAGTIGTDIDYSAESDQLYLWAGIRFIF